VQGALPDRRLELAGRALGDHAAVVDDRDPVGELVGLVEVLRAQQHGRALADERAHDLPHLVARARVEPRGRLVEDHQARGDDDAGGDVEPPAHAAGVVLDLARRGVGEAERLQQLVGARLRVAARVTEQPREQDQVLAAGQVLVDRGELAGQAEEAAHGVGLGDDVVAEHARAAAVGEQQRGEHADGGGLAGAVGPEHAVDRLAGDGEVDAVDRAGGAEGLAEARGLDGERAHYGK
jgi:hypothetical protein